MRDDQKLYPESLADAHKENAGKSYEPSNGTEGQLFMERWCEHCTKGVDDGCDIATRAYWIPCGDPGYPTEWQYSQEGQPMCTAFVRIGHEEQNKPLPGQMELFQ